MPFYRWTDIIKDVQPGPTLPAGMSRRGIIVGDLMVCAHEAFPDLKPKPHSHPSAQLVIMLKGKMGMRIGGEERIIVPGEFAYVPANVEHSIVIGKIQSNRRSRRRPDHRPGRNIHAAAATTPYSNTLSKTRGAMIVLNAPPIKPPRDR